MVYPHYLIEEGTTAESVWGRIVTVGGGARDVICKSVFEF